MNQFFQPEGEFRDMKIDPKMVATIRIKKIIESLTENQKSHLLLSMFSTMGDTFKVLTMGLPVTLGVAEGYVLSVEILLSKPNPPNELLELLELYKFQLMEKRKEVAGEQQEKNLPDLSQTLQL